MVGTFNSSFEGMVYISYRIYTNLFAIHLKTVEFGYHFSAKEGISVLYKVLAYINSPILGEVKVRVTEVL